MKNIKYAIINKELIAENEAFISIKERACRFGDGIFESCKIVKGIIYNYEAHLARIICGLKALQIKADIKDLKDLCYKLITKNQITNGNLRISISRGAGSRGYLPQENLTPLIIIEAMEAYKVEEKKIRLGISKIKLYPQNNFLQNCKSMQSLNYVMAKINARKANNFDDIMLNHKNYVAECSSSNIFWVKNNQIFTPSKQCNLLAGTIRKRILEKLPLAIKQVKSQLKTLLNADEIFITNANLLILPIDEIIFKNKIYKFKNDTTSKIRKLLDVDVEKYLKKNQ